MTDPEAISPLWIVGDLGVSVDFYTKTLGFELRYQVPEDAPFFAIVGRGGVQLHLKEIDEGVRGVPNRQIHEWAAWDAFVFVSDPEALGSDFSERGLSPTPRVEARDDGLLGFSVTDPDGFVLFFGRPN